MAKELPPLTSASNSSLCVRVRVRVRVRVCVCVCVGEGYTLQFFGKKIKFTELL